MARDYQNNITGDTEVAWTAGDEFYKHIYSLLRHEFTARSKINEYGNDYAPLSVALENWLEVLETIYNFTIDFFNTQKYQEDNNKIQDLLHKIEEKSKGHNFKERGFNFKELMEIKQLLREASRLLTVQCARHGLLLPKREKTKNWETMEDQINDENI